MIYDLIIIPLLFILRWTLIPWIPKARERVHFEKRARHFKGARSFKLDGITADLAVEFSSEGEFQQCLPIVDVYLREGKKVELIYFSPSVEKGVNAFYEKYPAQIRVLNFPLLTYSPTIEKSFRRWVSANKLILVRYDFLPEILLWSKEAGNELNIIWASFKKKRLKAKVLSSYQLMFFRNAKNIIAATNEDKEYLQKHGLDVSLVYDFRIIQILNRLKQAEGTLNQKFPQWGEFKSFLAQFRDKDRFLFGNAWPEDLKLLSEKVCDQIENKEKLFVIVPHLVGGEHIQNWKSKIQELNLSSIEITPESSISEVIQSFQQSPSVIIIHLKGVLCELYHFFQYSYVGGGLGVSVHSLLEPFVSGAQYISCGPKTERSTEIDLSNQDFPVVSILNSTEDFSQWINLTTGDNLADRQKKLEKYLASFDDVRKRF